MAILHTPRTLVSIARGLLRQRWKLASTSRSTVEDGNSESSADVASRFVGLVPTARHHVYRSRPSILWDVDYLGHMNNAAYLTHAEYARWEWTAENGALRALFDRRTNFVVTNTAVRFRREIPLRDPFEIHSFLGAIDDRNLWIYQIFRGDGRGQTGRILAQVLVQAAMVQKKKGIIPPRNLLDWLGVPKEHTDALAWQDTAFKDASDDTLSFLQRFKDLDTAFRKEATSDDERLLASSRVRRGK